MFRILERASEFQRFRETSEPCSYRVTTPGVAVLLTSGERVHDGLLGDSAGVHHLLGLADLSVGLGKLQSDGLWEVRVKPHSLL